MLSQPTPFPYVGSYALLEHEGELQLVRIQMRREGEVVVSFPLRDGASGNLRVNPAGLVDASPLSPDEVREFHELDGSLRGKSLKTPKQKAELARRDAMRWRMIHAPVAARLLRQLRDRQQRKAA